MKRPMRPPPPYPQIPTEFWYLFPQSDRIKQLASVWAKSQRIMRLYKYGWFSDNAE